jgi:hypothetical protein
MRSRISFLPVKFLLRGGTSPQITGTAPDASGSASVIKHYRTRRQLIAAGMIFLIFIAESHDNRVVDDVTDSMKFTVDHVRSDAVAEPSRLL